MTKNQTEQLFNDSHRRLTLGLPITGPYSRNRRRRQIQWSNAVPYLVSAGAVAWIIVLIVGLFTA